MNKNLTWKITSGVLALALVVLNVAVPAYEKRKATQLDNTLNEIISGYKTASQEQRQAMMKNAMSAVSESEGNAIRAHADFLASNGAYTSGG